MRDQAQEVEEEHCQDEVDPTIHRSQQLEEDICHAREEETRIEHELLNTLKEEGGFGEKLEVLDKSQLVDSPQRSKRGKCPLNPEAKDT